MSQTTKITNKSDFYKLLCGVLNCFETFLAMSCEPWAYSCNKFTSFAYRSLLIARRLHFFFNFAA